MTAKHRLSRGIFVGSVATIAYTYVGYPAILAAVHRLRGAGPQEPVMPEMPSVTLIVAAYNEEAHIGARLRNLRELDFPADRLQVVVVADGSDDRTPVFAAEEGALVLHRPERAGKAAALDRGVQVATGEILVFSDANNLYERQTLRELLAPFGDPTVGVVTGSKRISDRDGRALDHAEGAYWRYESAIKRWESALGSVTGVAGEILALRRAAYTALPAGTVNDDFTLAMQAALDGWRIAYAGSAVSLEPASATIDDEATRRARIVAGRYRSLVRLLPALARRRPLLAWQVVSHKGLRPLVPFAMIAAALSNARLVRGSGVARATFVGQLGFYLLATAGALAERGGRPQSRLTYLPYYLCRVNAAALAGVAELFSGEDVTLWERVARGSDVASEG